MVNQPDRSPIPLGSAHYKVKNVTKGRWKCRQCSSRQSLPFMPLQTSNQWCQSMEGNSAQR